MIKEEKTLSTNPSINKRKSIVSLNTKMIEYLSEFQKDILRTCYEAYDNQKMIQLFRSYKTLDLS